ncbi:hypothetical protein MtrunA17_Chr5g0421031 [Medicago truncatula]|uniref:Transmembrane protein n=1 Tax=Medicago truncatula TaxID=3880 RepID=A0A396HQV1_MEDTR|nr:hypothetical protein MtrunA17_Chr5g0421031 [Medicago truncatula]
MHMNLGMEFRVVCFLKPVLWPIVCFWFAYYSLEALVLAYGLNASTWICFLWFEDTSHGYASLLACIWFFLSRLGIGGHLFFNFGTLVLLLHGTFGVQFVQHMTSFHCKLWPFLALLFLLDIIIDFGYPYSSCLVLLFMMVKLC